MGEKNTNLNIRTSKALKEDVENILHKLGLNNSIVINMLYRQIQILKGIPFPIKLPNKKTQEAIDELENNKDLSVYEDSEDLFDDLEI